MRNLDDAALERRLREVLADHLGALPLDLTVDALDRRRRAGRVDRRFGRRRSMALLAAAALFLIGGALAVGSGLLRPTPVVVNATASPDAKSPVPGESTAPSAPPIPVAGPGGVWIPTGSMVTPRSEHTAVRLLDGRVLVVGGNGGGEFDAPTAELYDPSTGTWSTTGSMLNPADGPPPVVLLDGRVLVGDVVDGSNGNPDVYGSELYDPATGTWSATGDTVGSWGPPAVALQDGRVLANGSVYDPASGTWTATGKMNIARWRAATTLLSDGKVLVAGGYVDVAEHATDSAEVYDPATGSWTKIANMRAPHAGGMAATLPDGRALLATVSGSWEIYDPASGTWTAVQRPSGFDAPRALLSDGTVLVASAPETCDAAALYDPRTASLTTASSMLRCVDGTSFTLLLDGTVLMAGGRDCNGDGVCVSNGSAALYVPAGMPLPPWPSFPSPAPPVFPSPTPVPTPLPPAVGPIPPNARSWTVTVENRSSAPAALFVGNLGDSGIETLVGSATPNVVPAGATLQVTFLFPAIDDGWIYVNPRPGDGGALVNAAQIGIPGRILITAAGNGGWLSP